MGETALVDPFVADAISLVKQLDEGPNSPTFVAWYYYDEADEWRLLIASPSLDPLLQKQEAVAYQKVIVALSQTSPFALSVSDLKIVPTSYPLVQALGTLVKTGTQGTSRFQFRDCMIGGVFIKDVTILRSV